MANDSMDVDVVVVKLKSNDGKFFQFTETEASCSNALKRMLESSSRQCSAGNNGHYNSGPSIHLQTIDSKVLSNIHQWCKMHCYNQPAAAAASSSMTVASKLQDSNFNQYSELSTSSIQDNNQEPTDWDMKFLRSFAEIDLLKLMHGANFLDVKGLYDACCKFMAAKWEGMRVDEIRRRYNIRGDLPAEVEAQLIQENKKLGMND